MPIFSDGHVFKDCLATVTVERDRIEISLVDAALKRSWHLSDVEFERDSDGLLVTASDGFLRLSKVEWARLAREFPILKNYGRFGGEMRTVASYALATAGVFALFLFGIHWAATPLSHMITVEAERRWFGDVIDQKNSSASDHLEAMLKELGPPNGISIQLDDDSDVVNAYALPGARILVTKGLICFAKRPEEIIGVIGHEVGHIRRRHIIRGVISNLTTQLILQIMTGGGTSASIANQVISNQFSVKDEVEADEISAELMINAGLDPSAAADFFTRLDKKEDPTFRKLGRLLSDHPANENRIRFFKEKAVSLQLVEQDPQVRSAREETWKSLRREAKCEGSEHSPDRSNPQNGTSPAKRN